MTLGIYYTIIKVGIAVKIERRKHIRNRLGMQDRYLDKDSNIDASTITAGKVIGSSEMVDLDDSYQAYLCTAPTSPSSIL